MASQQAELQKNTQILQGGQSFSYKFQAFPMKFPPGRGRETGKIHGTGLFG